MNTDYVLENNTSSTNPTYPLFIACNRKRSGIYKTGRRAYSERNEINQDMSVNPSHPEESFPIEPIDTQVGMVTREAYSKSCQDFRIAVTQLLYRNNALGDHIGWAVFDLFVPEEGSVAMADGQIDLFVGMKEPVGVGVIDRFGPAFKVIRLISNEQIMSLDNTTQYLTVDFTLSSTGGAQYNVGAFTIDEEGHAAPGSTGTLFQRNGSSVSIATQNFSSLAHTNPLHEDGETLYPLGTTRSLIDRIDALAVGQSMLASISGIEPTEKWQSIRHPD